MRRLALLFVTATAAMMASACTGEVQTRGTVVATSDGYYEPDLVYVSPGVSVIADYDEPVFFSDNYYWRYNGGRWYRSTSYNRGWTYYSAPPRAIVGIDRPYAYRHYRPHGYTVRRGGPVNRGGVIRDHRGHRR
jgi:hypothetical protein